MPLSLVAAVIQTTTCSTALRAGYDDPQRNRKQPATGVYASVAAQVHLVAGGEIGGGGGPLVFCRR